MGKHEDFLSYNEALEFAFNLVVQHTLKANQEHFGKPESISEVHKLPKDEQDCWLKAAQDEIQSLVENGTFQLVQLRPECKAIGLLVQHPSDRFQRPKSSSKKSSKIYRTRKPT